MKKIITLIITIHCSLFTIHLSGQSCLPEGITFNTQAQIDSFQINYPGCTEIEGNVKIGGSTDITSLMGLNILTSIGGNLWIHLNYYLTSLAGLDNLTSIGGDLSITNNYNMTCLEGIENINSGTIEGLNIYHNTELSACEVQNICEYLQSPNGSVNIHHNGDGCNKPGEIASACGFTMPCLPYGNYYFYSQTDIDDYQSDFPGCTEIEGRVYIGGWWGSSNINNLDSLILLTSVGGDLEISSNDSLTSLAGLDNLNTVSGTLEIGSYALISLEGLESLISIGGSLKLYFNNLKSLTGLEGMTSIGGYLEIWSNDSLTNLMGLEGLTSIGEYMRIWQNANLNSLTGLENVEANTISNLYIYGNTSLSTCHVQSICDYLLIPNGTIEIHDNATGCNSPEEVEEACETVGEEELAVGSQHLAVSIYPNPATNTLSLVSQPGIELISLEILDTRGKVILHQDVMDNNFLVNVSNYPGGFYFVRILSSEGIEVEKLVIQ